MNCNENHNDKAKVVKTEKKLVRLSSNSKVLCGVLHQLKEHKHRYPFKEVISQRNTLLIASFSFEKKSKITSTPI
ncbi:MAG: hypothetical protein Q4B97_06350 [Lachnospiraceae bacterium]|nr:hypothetical protein [Lachnospiraceae bacterium]